MVSLNHMKIIGSNQLAFSLLEVLLASIIFILSVGGVFLTLAAMRGPVADKETALSSAIFGKQVLETLRAKVDAGSFFNSCSVQGQNPCQDFSLSLGVHYVTNIPGLTWPPDLTANAINYTVSCATDGSTAACSPDIARKVQLNLVWNNST